MSSCHQSCTQPPDSKAMASAFSAWINTLPRGYEGREPVNPGNRWFDAFEAGVRWRGDLPHQVSNEGLRAAAERMVQTFRDWMAGCENETRWKEVEAAHINLRDTLAKLHVACTHDWVAWTDGLGGTGSRCRKCHSECN